MNKKRYLQVGMRIVAFKVDDVLTTSENTDKYALDIYEDGWQDGSVRK